MDQDMSGDMQDVLRPIASLIGKSEKAQLKLAPGTWHHTMLRGNVKALRLGFALLSGEAAAGSFTGEDLQEALGPFASMIERTEKALVKFSPGTSQHSLGRNRLHALRVAQAAIEEALGQDPTRASEAVAED